MIQPAELKLDLPIKVGGGQISTTRKVWHILSSAHDGNLENIKSLVAECPGLIYAQYNYAPPIHFAVREGHLAIVKYLLAHGAYDPAYRIYPFQESLEAIAEDRGYNEIVELLKEYVAQPMIQQHSGDNGEIDYRRTPLQTEFEQSVSAADYDRVTEILNKHPEFARDSTYFWSEGILTFAVKGNDRKMIDLLMRYGAGIPDVLKWTQFYYFEHSQGAAYIMEKGMNPNTMSWQHVTILHDMAQKGNVDKARLLIKYGANLNPIEEAYQSTPLGLAARWGHIEIVRFLIRQGADLSKAGAPWSTPFQWARKKGFRQIELLLRSEGAQ